ncbi:MAG TPA: methyltransferase domain-containing protein [Candidatus Methanoperedens sp.]|nr:methyltransferase domain-containing protein [Candidatus Methanoperedens sp.]
MTSLSKKYWEKDCDGYIKLLDNTDNYPSPYTQIIVPAILKILKKYTKVGDKVLDLGCGEGFLTRQISAQKRHTFGCDLSPEMINAAKNHSPKIDYWIQDIEKKDSNHKDKPKFKLVVSNLVFTYLKKIDITLNNVSQYLDSNGHLIIIIPHPCFYHQENYRWFMEQDNKPYQIGKYFEEKTYIKEIYNGVMTHYIHRTLQNYIDIFSKNKFSLVQFLEPQSKNNSTRVLAKASQIPNIAIFILKKTT